MKTVTLWFLALLAFVLVLSVTFNARAARLDGQGCIEYAIWSRDVIWAREVGADKEKVRTSLVDLVNAEHSAALALVLKDFDALWATRVDRVTVAEKILEDCARRRGLYPETI